MTYKELGIYQDLIKDMAGLSTGHYLVVAVWDGEQVPDIGLVKGRAMLGRRREIGTSKIVTVLFKISCNFY